MHRQWKEYPIWPGKDAVKFFTATDFKTNFPNTRATIDGTEMSIQKTKDPLAQQQTFSHCKNKNTVKVLVSCTPEGFVYDVTCSYGEAASDR